MKVLLVETLLSGHRMIYHKTLIQKIGSEKCILITPDFEQAVHCEQIVDKSVNLRPRNIKEYYSWLKHIKKIANEKCINTIHLLDGDLLYRFCGFMLEILKDYKVIVTFHHVGENLLHRISVKMIISKISYGVVHTEYLKNRFQHLRKINLIDYPYFPNGDKPGREESRIYYEINDNAIVLLALGGTRYEKGIDILLEAMKYVVREDVILLIAGREEHFKRNNLALINTNKVKVTYHLKELSDFEWNMALAASDYVILPYRKSFAGASGPLTEAVWFEKPVIGKSDGSIGELIRNNDLGWTFEAENIADLSKNINEAINGGFIIGDRYNRFRNKISAEAFGDKYMNLYKE